MRVTLQDVQNSSIPDTVGMCPGTSTKFIQLLNDAQQRLIWEGLWWGTCARFTICATSGCVTLPRQIATLETVAVCRRPIRIHDFWFEFLENGLGIRGQNSCWPEANMKGNYPIITDIIGTNKKARAVCDLALDAGKTVLLLGYDVNNNWVRTLQGGVYADGELVTLSTSPGTNSATLWSSITDIQVNGPLSGQWWLYEYDTTLLTQRLLGNYQYYETRPSYARYFIPTVFNCCGNASTPVAIDCIGKKEVIPVVSPTDYMIIGNIPALEQAMLALSKSRKEQDGLKANAILQAGINTAKSILDGELTHYLGSSRDVGITMMGAQYADGCPVPNFI